MYLEYACLVTACLYPVIAHQFVLGNLFCEVHFGCIFIMVENVCHVDVVFFPG